MADFIKRDGLPSYKTPGVYPDGSDLEVGLDSPNLLRDSLGNWNNIIRDEGPVDDEGNSTPRVFISFGSDTELVTPTADASGQEAIGRRPIFIKVKEDLIRQYGFTTILTKGYSWDDWYDPAAEHFKNQQNAKAVEDKIKTRDTFKEYQNFGGNVELQDVPWDIIANHGMDDVSMEQMKMITEEINEYIELVKYYWDVSNAEITNFIAQSEEEEAAKRRTLWDTLTEGKFRNNLFNNPISVDDLLSYIRPTEQLDSEYTEAGTLIFPEDWTIEPHSDIDFEDITAKLSPPFYIPNTTVGYYEYDTQVSFRDFTSQNATLYGEFTDKRYFPRAFEIINPSEISNYDGSWSQGQVFVKKLLSFPVEALINPVSNIIVDSIITSGHPGASFIKSLKLGFPHFSYDYIFAGLHSIGSMFISGVETSEIELPADAKVNTDYEVNCYFEHDNEQIPLKYYDIDSEEYRLTSYPLKINLDVDVWGDEVSAPDPYLDYNRQTVFELVDYLYADDTWLAGNLTNIITTPFHYRYEVVQWGDEETLLTDEQIEASYYFKMYDIEDYPPSTDSYEYKKFVQSHVSSKPFGETSHHVYSTPGIKRIKMVVYKMSSNGIFILQTYLVQKNLVVSDGNLASHDFAVFGAGDFRFLPVKNNQIVIGGLSSGSFYNESVTKIVKDNTFVEEDYLEKVSSLKFVDKFNRKFLGEAPPNSNHIDLGQTRMYKEPKDIFDFIGGNKETIISENYTMSTGSLPVNSLATDIFINDDKCIVDLNPSRYESFTVPNQIGGEAQGVVIGDYKLVQPRDRRIRREGNMKTPDIVKEIDRQPF